MQSNVFLVQQDGEEGWTDLTDPYITMNFYHRHPLYWNGSTWTDWPASPSKGGPPPGPGNQTANHFVTNPLSECPAHYGGILNYSDDSRYWYTGSGGSTCAGLNNPITQF